MGNPEVIHILSWAIYCLGAAFLVRAAIFGIIIDVARILIPALIFVLMSGGAGLFLASVAALTVWGALLLIFFFCREEFWADDILLSLGFQTATFGFMSVMLNTMFSSKHMLFHFDPLASHVMVALLAAISILSILLLSFSAFRVGLAHAAERRGPSGIYPNGTRRFRLIAMIGAGLCMGAGTIALMTVTNPSLSQWSDGIGILLFGIAYALKGRALYCFCAGGSVAYVQIAANKILGSGLSDIPPNILSVSHILMGGGIIIIAMIVQQLLRREHQAL